MAGYRPKSFKEAMFDVQEPPALEPSAPAPNFTPKSFQANPAEHPAEQPGFIESLPQRTRAALKGVLSNVDVDPAKAAADIEAPFRKGGRKEAYGEFAPAYEAASRDYPTEEAFGAALPGLLAPAVPLVQGGIGALRGYGNSDSPTIGGKLKDAATEAAVSAGVTKLGNVAANFIGKGRLARWLGGKSQAAETEQLAKQAAAKAKAVKSASGAMGTPAAQTMRADEVLRSTLGDLAPESKAAAEKLLSSPEWKAMRTRAAERYLEQAPQFLDDFAAAESKLGAAKAIDAEAQAAEKLAHPIKSEVLPRLKKYATRAVPAYLGQKVAGDAGGGTDARVAGGLVGFGAGAALGDPGTAVANMLKSPAFRKGAADLSGAALRKLGGAAEQGAKALGITKADQIKALIADLLSEEEQ